MIDKTKKQKLNLMLLATLLLVLLAASVVGSLAWLTNNKKVDAEGIELEGERPRLKVEYINATADPELKNWELLDGNDELNLGAYLRKPGKKVTYMVRVTNEGDQVCAITGMGLLKPSESQEVAAEAKKKPSDTVKVKAFLGTQLYATLTGISCSDMEAPTVVSADAPLATGGAGDTVVTSEIPLYQDADGKIVLTKNQAVTFMFTITFKNEDFAQDEYKHFGRYDEGTGSYNGYCARNLYVEFEVLSGI